MHSPFVVLFEQDRADEARYGLFVGEDADDLGTPLDFAVDTPLADILIASDFLAPSAKDCPRGWRGPGANNAG